MKKITLAFLFFLLQTQSGLFAQLDPSLMSKLSQLSPQQRQQLMSQKSSGGTQPGGLAPTTDLKTRALEVETPDEESFESRSNFLKDLAEMEAMVSKDIEKFEKERENKESFFENESALSESRSLLQKIKQVQRKEIEKRADEFGNSTVDSIKPFGYDLFASDPSTFAPGNEVPIPSDYRIGPGDVVEIQLFGQRNNHTAWVYPEKV